MIVLIPESQKPARTFCSVVSLALMFCYFASVTECAFAAERQQRFAALDADVDIDIEDGELEFMATFRLGPGSNGIDPVKERVILQLKGGSGEYSLTIPAGSFKEDRREFTFQGTIDRVRLRASIRPLPGGAFEFALENERAHLKSFANPVSVSLAIGDDGGSTTLKAKIE